jgi:hypothetical protein
MKTQINKKKNVASRVAKLGLSAKANVSVNPKWVRSNGENPLLAGIKISQKQATDFGAKTVTANGAITPVTTASAVLDFFSQAGAFRGKDEATILSVFNQAFSENPLLALRALFYFRDVRGGQGERRLFRVIIKSLAANHKAALGRNLSLVPVFGRWDDLFELFDTQLERDMMILVNNQLAADLDAEKPSLLAKWLPSENASSSVGRIQARSLSKFFGISPREYRKALSLLRAKIKIVETSLCKKEYGNIEYDKIPSRAGMVYRKAFSRNDKERYAVFLGAVEKGEKTINAGALFPYDICHKVLGGESNDTLEALWKNLPDYFGENKGNRIAVVDVSSSMNSGLGSNIRPMDVSISLGLYIAERCQGPFQNHFITFSHQPKLEQVRGSSLSEKIKNMHSAEWGGNTDLQKVFELILSKAKAFKVSQADMPSELYIISDMQFDTACQHNSISNFEVVKQKYAAAGYKMPKLIFWNVNASPNQTPVQRHEINTVLVSGCSPSILVSLLSSKTVTPYDFMLEVLNKPRYSQISV